MPAWVQGTKNREVTEMLKGNVGKVGKMEGEIENRKWKIESKYKNRGEMRSQRYGEVFGEWAVLSTAGGGEFRTFLIRRFQGEDIFFSFTNIKI